MTAHAWVLVAVCLLCAAPRDTVCSHPDRGDSRPAALDRIAAAQDDLQRRMASTWDRAPRLTAEAPLDSGLPSCKSRQSRKIRTTLPKEFVGRAVVFAPSERMPGADVRVATSARRISEIQADALADRRLIDRLGVRCTPTRVRAISEVELELVEDP
jgi:hypothetical protein